MIEWACTVCASPWHLVNLPPDDAGCIYCGGEIDCVDPYWQWPRLRDENNGYM